MDIRFDVYNRPEPSKVYLAQPSGEIVCCLNGIQENTCSFNGNGQDLSTISFTVDRFIEIDGELVESNGYEYLHKFMRLYVENIGWFILKEPDISNDGVKETKSFTADSDEVEFMQADLVGFKINCGTVDSREMMIDSNVEVIDGVKLPKERVKFYYPEKPELSLLNILIEDYPAWKIGYVDTKPKIYDEDTSTPTSIQLKDEIGKFSVDSQNIYSFMTQDIQQFFECILVFDNLHHIINAYRVENIGKDTNINIGFRNFQNSNEITVDENNIYTRYTVAGADNLGISYVNFGSNQIEYLHDHFLNQKFLSKELIVKYKKWRDYVESIRPNYITLSKQYNAKQDVISELKNRVPLDGCSTDWSTYESVDALQTVKTTYQAQLLGYEKLYVDKDGNFDETALKASKDANDYYQIKDVIIPSIDIEIANRALPTSEGEKDYIDSWETDWKLYGLDELQVKIDMYTNSLSLLKENHYDLSYDDYVLLVKKYADLVDTAQKAYDKAMKTGTTEQQKKALEALQNAKANSAKYPSHTLDSQNNMHKQYLDTVYQLDATHFDSCKSAFNNRTIEVGDAERELETIYEQRAQLAYNVDKKNWKDNQNIGFTKQDLIELHRLYNDTDYTNESVLTVRTDTTDQIIDTQYKLFKLAMDDLYSSAQPQYKYTTSLDSFLPHIQYQEWSKELSLFNYLWLGVRDDNVVKLRLIGYDFNPMVYDNKLNLSFTNMIRGRNKRNDFIEILKKNSNTAKNKITSDYNSSKKDDDASIHLTSGLLQQILSSGAFGNKVNSIINGQFGNLSGDYIYTKNLEAEMIKTIDIKAENGFFQYLRTELLSAGSIVADDATFKKLEALVANIDNLLAGTISAELGHIIKLTAKNVQIDEAVIRDLIASQITVSMLKAGKINTNEMNLESADGGLRIVGNTMQFKDSTGNIRIQIGRDAKDNFTFALYDTSGQGVLIDETGIKESAISTGTIKTDMIADKAITNSKIDKTGIHEWVDDKGNKVFDVSNMYFGNDKFTVSYNSVKENAESAKTQSSALALVVDQQAQEIQQKASKNDITNAISSYDGSTVETIRTQVTQNTTSISGISSSVSDITTELTKKADGSMVTALTERVSKAEQDATGFKQIVEQTYATKGELDDMELGGINLLVKLNITKGKYLTATGAINTDENWFYSDFIKVKGFKNTVTSGYTNLGIEHATCFYNEQKVYISGIKANSEAKTANMVIPDTAWFMRVSGLIADLPTYKVEKGTKSTSYSPAPEDVTSSISSVTQTATQIQQSVSALDGRVSQVTTNLEGVTTRVADAEGNITEQQQKANEMSQSLTTLSGDYAKFKATSEGFQTEVGNKYVSKEYLSTLDIAGRNLLKKSNVLNTSSEKLIKDYYFGLVKPINNELHTISIKGSLGEGRASFSVYNSGDTVLLCTISASDKNQDGFYVKTFTHNVADTTNTFIRVIQNPDTASTSSTIEQIKLESGSSASSYSIAPEDITDGFDDVNSSLSSIKQTQDSIDQSVTNLAGNIASITTTADGIKNRVEKIEDGITDINGNKIPGLEGIIRENSSQIELALKQITTTVADIDGLKKSQSDMVQDANGWRFHLAKIGVEGITDIDGTPLVDPNTCMTINEYGIEITRSADKGYKTVINGQDFSGYYYDGNQLSRVFGINKDTVYTSRLLADDGIDTETIKIKPVRYTLTNGATIGGLAFVKSGGTS